MTRRVLIISHADADGHLIAEQVRRNFSLIDSFDVSVVVDPERTKDHKCWLKLDMFPEIDGADLVFFMDLMFAPATFVNEANSLVEFVRDRPGKQFFLMDHHPLPLQRLGAADNLRVAYRPEVFDCVIGPRSGMMVLAAICENQTGEVADIAGPAHSVLARGMKRAAAPGGDLAGKKLLALLQSDQWHFIFALGNDSPEFHQLVRGRRIAGRPQSKVMNSVSQAASSLLMHPGREVSGLEQIGGTAMAYDVQVGHERFSEAEGGRRRTTNAVASPRDLEAILTLLEIAAIELTTTPDATFTADELIAAAREIAGDDVEIDEKDIKIVLQKPSFLKKVGGGQLRLK